MAEYRVHLTGFQSASITVDADDPDAAIDEALNEGIPNVCAQCGGWGQKWSRDEGDEWTPESVTDETGNEVWAGPTNVGEAIIRELSNLRADLGQSPMDAVNLINARLEKLRTGQ